MTFLKNGYVKTKMSEVEKQFKAVLAELESLNLPDDSLVKGFVTFTIKETLERMKEAGAFE